MRFKLPFTYVWVIKRKLDRNSDSLLDIGCGKGSLIQLINEHKHLSTVGIDLFLPYIKDAHSHKTHNEYVMCDARFLPFRPKSFDIVLCPQLIEHLHKTDGVRLIKEAERIAKRQVIFTTPKGFLYRGGSKENPLEAHKSAWVPQEFTERNYGVRGQGLHIVYGEHGLAYRFPLPIRWGFYILSFSSGPIVYFFPSLGAQLICVKNMLPDVRR